MLIAHAEAPRQTLEKRSVPDPCAAQMESPGVRGLMEERVALLRRGQVSRDRDDVGSPVADLSAGELSPREADGCRAESQESGEPVVETLEPRAVVQSLDGKKRRHPLRLARSGTAPPATRSRALKRRRGRAMSRSSVSFAFASFLAAGLAAAAPAGKMTSYPSGSETVSGYLVVPDGGGKKPAIVVIQEWWGLNDFVKQKADHFAAEGFVALAPDLYRGRVATDADTAHQLMRGMPEDRAMRDLKGAVAALRARPDVDPARIASIGWCMGGGYSLALAVAEPGLAGTVLYYGRLVTDPATIAGLKVPLLGNFGGKDQGITPESVRAFADGAKAAGRNVDFKIYPDAGHAFASSPDPKVFRAQDAQDADARTEAFLAKLRKGR